MTITCWVIDDEPAAHKGIELALTAHNDFRIVYHGYSADEPALGEKPKPDVIFLDIDMPRVNGFQFLASWQGALPCIVFITAYQQYALAAFDNNALDYLLKPIEQPRFAQMIAKVRQRLKEKQLVSKHSAVEQWYQQVVQQTSLLGLSVQTDEGLFYLKQKDIIYIEAVADHLAFYLNNKTLLSRDTFKRLSQKLDHNFFFRSHKSLMVNTAHVIKFERGRFGDGTLVLSNGASVKLSRRYKAILANIKPSPS